METEKSLKYQWCKSPYIRKKIRTMIKKGMYIDEIAEKMQISNISLYAWCKRKKIAINKKNTGGIAGENIETIKQLLKEGFNKSQISEKLNISKQLISRACKRFKVSITPDV